jgi:hypothetical protein
MAKLPDVSDLGPRPIPQPQRRITRVRNAGAVGEAVAGAGAVVTKAGSELEDLDQRRQAAQAGVDYAKLAEELQLKANEKRATAQPGAIGHLESIEAETDQRIGGFLSSIRDKDLRKSLGANTAQLRARIVTGEDAWAIEQRRGYALENVKEAGRLLANQLQTNPTAETLQEYLDVTRSTIIGQDDLSAGIAEIAVREQQARLAKAYVEGLTEKNPTAAREVMTSGILNQYLDDSAVSTLTDRADSEVRVREADGRRELSAARSAAQAKINLLQKRLTDHDPTITDAELAEAQQLAQDAQLPLEIYDTAKARVMREVDRLYGKASGLEISNAVRDLNTKITKEGDKAKPEDVVRRDHLQSLLNSRQQQDQHDPLTSYSRRGGEVAPVDFENAGSVQGRLATARAAEKEVGYFQFFTPQEAELLQERVASGSPGRLEVINHLASIGQYDTQAATRAAQQIAPNDATFIHAMRVAPNVRRLIVNGVEARKLLPAQLEREDGTTAGFNAATQATFVAHYAPSLSLSTPDFVNGVLESARNIYAERLRQQGNSSKPEFDAREFGNAVNTALGQTRAGGGIGRWTWGARTPDGGFPGMLLPSGMSETEFHRRMANLPKEGEGRKWPARSVNGPPIWPDGSSVTIQQIHRRFVPVAVSDGVYQFHSGGQVLMTRGGQPWKLDIRKIEPYRSAPAAPGKAAPAGPTPWRPAVPLPRNDIQGPFYGAPPEGRR